MSIKCRIRYLAGSIRFDYEPGCANFSYWLYKKINEIRFSSAGNGIWLTCEISEEEARYIEQLAIAQFGPESCEVIGQPVSITKIEELPKKAATPEPVSFEQLSLF